MNLKIYISSLLAALGAFSANAQTTAKDTITDSNIVYPSSFDTDVKAWQDNWYRQRYAALDSVARTKTGVKATDAVYVDRLQKLPNIIEMPYNSVVKQYIEMYAEKRKSLVEKMIGMSLYYMPIFEEALERYQLPNELKYLPVIESALDPNAVSKSGACGLWQLMPATATGEGLEMNTLVDMRRDPYAASNAAAHYLSTLYDMFKDWTLAIAAYNCGPGTLNKAIKRAKSNDYWVIYPYLPAETRGYVPAFIAANYIMNYYPEHGISHALARRPMVTDTVHVTNRVHLQQISEVMGLPIDEIRVLNPQYRKDIIPGHVHPYSLTLPSVQAYCYITNEDSILKHDPEKFFGREIAEPYTGTTDAKSEKGSQYVDQLVVKEHVVAKGESLKSIAKQYGVTAESIRRNNHLSSNRVKQGTVLQINTYEHVTVPVNDLAENTNAGENATDDNNLYANQAPQVNDDDVATPTPTTQQYTKKASKTSKASQSTTYTVKSGDSLSRIAKKHGTTVAKLQAANPKLKNLKPGDKVVIPGKASTTTKAKSSKSSTKKSSAKKSSKKKKRKK